MKKEIEEELKKLEFELAMGDYHDGWCLQWIKEKIKEFRPVINCEWFPRTDPWIKELLSFCEYESFCGYSLNRVSIGQVPWRQELILVPKEKIDFFNL